MFFLSKLFWTVFAPSHVLLWLNVGACVTLLTGRRRVGTYLASFSLALLIVCGVLPTFVWLARPIEFRYARPQHLPVHVDGILVLGGGRDDIFRLSAAYALARQYPRVRVVYSGGSNGLILNRPGSDAQRAGRILAGLGLNSRQITLEDRSRNTWENFVFTRQLVKPNATEVWVLAAPALQMPRAMEIARRLDWKFLPWPTNWVSGQDDLPRAFQIPENLRAFDESVREWIGLYAYRLSGKALKTNGGT